MITNDFQGKKLSLLGFGTMRLPLESDDPNAKVDEKKVFEMVKYASEHGVNYYDTAYPYHGGESERIIGRALKQLPRESFYLATKYPGHQISSRYDPAAIFEEQLEKCQVDYFDFYLLHNVYENSIQTYMDPKWGIIDYFLEQKKKGRIRHLGFSTHGRVELIETFLERYGDEMEFCQIQLNYLDWTLQDAKAKYELLTKYNIPVWVMEPVRGGRLASLSEKDETTLKQLRPDESIASWAFRWLQALPNVKMVLSGMSNMEQMIDNVKTFSEEKPLSEKEIHLLEDIAETMKDSLPCTGCRYCCDGCPQQIDIPKVISYYNETRFSPNFNIGMAMEAIAPEHQPSACIECGQCTHMCPQNIDIPKAMKDFAEILDGMPSWAEICHQRDEANRRNQRK